MLVETYKVNLSGILYIKVFITGITKSCGNRCKVAYVHTCEGSAKSDTGETSSSTGKLINDFIKIYRMK